MKKILVSIATAGLLLVFVAASPRMQHRTSANHRQDRDMTAFMHDSSAMNAMMDRIASNGSMSRMMMSRMLHHAQSDSTYMRNLCSMFLNNGSAHSMMMQMMNGTMMSRNGMMMNGMMNGGFHHMN